ncbi:hypothetical protein TW65_08010 [Stemphylium lycopersici]|nr:hypothetical protein TW65_08010 [Stemphylium lycopersici]
MPTTWTLILAVLAAFPVVHSHSWGEQLRNIDDKGNYVGAYGYARGMVDRGQTGPDGKSTDDTMTWRMPESNTQGKIFIDDQQLLCPPTQREQKQSENFPRLKAAPGGFIAIRYQENGHVTLPQNNPDKPEKGGTVYVYGTKEPKTDEKLIDVLQWTQDAQGGDKRGVLLAMNDYDDGRCYLNNDSPVAQERKSADPAYMANTPQTGPANSVMYCETDVKLPDDVELDKTYTLYWVWQWTSLPGKTPGLDQGKDEYYSTCMDVDVASADVAMAALDAGQMSKFAMGQQDAVSTALSDWTSRTAVYTDLPLKREMGPVTSGLSGGGSGGDVPAPTGTAPAGTGSVPPAVTSAVPSIPSSAPPFLNSTIPATSQVPLPSSIPAAPSSAGLEIPTLSGRPGAAPTPPLSDAAGMVTVTNTVMVTVTAPAATQPAAPAITPRAAHSIHYKNGAKFRGVFAS